MAWSSKLTEDDEDPIQAGKRSNISQIANV